MVAFAGDVSRKPEPVREAYAQGLRDYLDAFVVAQGGTREEGMRSFFELVGALTLARSVAVSDPELSEEILASVTTRTSV